MRHTPYLTYTISHLAWYASAQPDLQDRREIMFGARKNSASGSFLYEFAIREHPTVGGLRVEVFSDSWDAFTDFPDLFELIRDAGTEDFDELVQVLSERYYDATPYERRP